MSELPEDVAPTSDVQTTCCGPVASSLAIVPTPWPSAIVAPTGADRFTRNVSVGSTAASPTTETAIDLLVWPGLNVRLPVSAP